MPNKNKLTVSVVTPSFNQVEYLPDCLASVATQSYPAMEHFVYDPGSSDGSRTIVRRYPHATLVAEPDAGQSDAVNKGFKRAGGDILAWINSDDYFADAGVFERVAARFEKPDHPDIVYGNGRFLDGDGLYLRDAYIHKRADLLYWCLQWGTGILQPATFIHRRVFETLGPLNNLLHYCMDYEYWIRCVKSGLKFVYANDCFASARYHIKNKTYGKRGDSFREVCEMVMSHYGYVNHQWLRRWAEYQVEGFDGVLKHSGKCPARLEIIEAKYRDLLDAYNGMYSTRKVLEQHAHEMGWRETLDEMKRLKIDRGTPCRPIPIDQKTENGCVCYTVGPRRWAYSADWKNKQIAKTHGKLRHRIKQRDKNSCVIAGNGPSLRQTDLSLLAGQDVIISNNAFLNSQLFEYATYYTVVNYLVAEQSAPYINLLHGVAKIIPYWLSYCINEGDETYFLDAVGYPEFSKDIFKNASWRHTVSFFNMHLAYGLGYKRAVLIGFDHNYIQQSGVKEGEIISQSEDDVNHFDPGYFKGKQWQAADTDNMEKMYILAKKAYEEDGREIVNATVGGKLELFKRIPLEQALRGE